MFDAFSAAEQACIRRELADDAVVLLGRPVLSTGDPEPWEVAVFSCLAPATARAVFLGGLIAEIEADDVELGESELACLREAVATVNVPAIVSLDDPALAEFSGSLIRCLPDVFVEFMVRDMGLDIGELSDEELACLRELLAETDVARLAEEPEVSALEARMRGCLPRLPFAKVGAPIADDHAWAPDGATLIAVGESAEGVLVSPTAADFFAFEAVEGTLYQIDVTLGTLTDSVAILRDAEGLELVFGDDHGSLPSRIYWEATYSGTHYIEVWGCGTGSYTLTVLAR